MLWATSKNLIVTLPKSILVEPVTSSNNFSSYLILSSFKISLTKAIVNLEPKTGHPIFLIGFDFDYRGKYVNHVYKGTENHPKENRPAQNENIFLNETLQIVNRYPKHNIIWVSDNKDFVIKINRITIQQYKNIVYNC